MSFAVRVSQCQALARFNGAALSKVDNGNGPKQAVSGLHRFCHRKGIGPVHIARKRGEVPCAHHDRVGGGGRAHHHGGEGECLGFEFGASRVVNYQGAQLAGAVGCNQCHGVSRLKDFMKRPGVSVLASLIGRASAPLLLPAIVGRYADVPRAPRGLHRGHRYP